MLPGSRPRSSIGFGVGNGARSPALRCGRAPARARVSAAAGPVAAILRVTPSELAGEDPPDRPDCGDEPDPRHHEAASNRRTLQLPVVFVGGRVDERVGTIRRGVPPGTPGADHRGTWASLPEPHCRAGWRTRIGQQSPRRIPVILSLRALRNTKRTGNGRKRSRGGTSRPIRTIRRNRPRRRVRVRGSHSLQTHRHRVPEHRRLSWPPSAPPGCPEPQPCPRPSPGINC